MKTTNSSQSEKNEEVKHETNTNFQSGNEISVRCHVGKVSALMLVRCDGNISRLKLALPEIVDSTMRRCQALGSKLQTQRNMSAHFHFYQSNQLMFLSKNTRQPFFPLRFMFPFHFDPYILIISAMHAYTRAHRYTTMSGNRTNERKKKTKKKRRAFS